MAHWLRPRAPGVREMGSVPNQGARSHMPQLRHTHQNQIKTKKMPRKKQRLTPEQAERKEAKA